jgi:hypothetical protein
MLDATGYSPTGMKYPGGQQVNPFPAALVLLSFVMLTASAILLGPADAQQTFSGPCHAIFFSR